jgi:Ca-activated chloride channel family protein
MLTFDQLYWLLVLPLPLLMTWLWPTYRERLMTVRLPFLDRLARLSGQSSERSPDTVKTPRGQRLLSWLVWALVVAALARPQWLEEPITRTEPARDLLVAVDLSGSMETQDFTDADGRQVDRLTAVKEVLRDFLARREDDRVALIVFGSAAFVQLPFTTDKLAVQQMLDETRVRMAGPKTMLGNAIGLAITLFERSEVPERMMIVLTDGNDTGSQVPPVRAAEIARDRDVVIHTIGVGDPSSAGEEEALDEAVLKSVATTTSGSYFHAADRDELEQIYVKLDELAPRKVETINHQPRRDLFYWPLGAALLLTLVFHGVGALASRRGGSRSRKGVAEESSAA